MLGHDIMVIGTSSGGVDALKRMVTSLPADLAASLFIVMHRPTHSPSLLAEILQSVCPLAVANAADGEVIAPGRIYIAPPDYHLLINPKRVRLTRGPKE